MYSSRYVFSKEEYINTHRTYTVTDRYCGTRTSLPLIAWMSDDVVLLARALLDKCQQEVKTHSTHGNEGEGRSLKRGKEPEVLTEATLPPKKQRLCDEETCNWVLKNPKPCCKKCCHLQYTPEQVRAFRRAIHLRSEMDSRAFIANRVRIDAKKAERVRHSRSNWADDASRIRYLLCTRTRGMSLCIMSCYNVMSVIGPSIWMCWLQLVLILMMMMT